MERLQFKEATFEFGESLAKKSKGNLAWFEFEGDYSNVETLKSSCQCTAPVRDGNTIFVKYNAGETSGPFRQSVTVFYDDGRPMKVLDPSTGNKVWNPLKTRDVLAIKGIVE